MRVNLKHGSFYPNFMDNRKISLSCIARSYVFISSEMYLYLWRTPAVTLDLYLLEQKKGMPLRQNSLLTR
jgi:hypothetical protein